MNNYENGARILRAHGDLSVRIDRVKQEIHYLCLEVAIDNQTDVDGFMKEIALLDNLFELVESRVNVLRTTWAGDK